MSLYAFTEQEALDLVERYPTPFFAYKLDIARARFVELRALLPDRVELAYAVKANPGLPLLTIFADMGSSFDCASVGELNAVRAAGGASRHILFAGPGKSEGDLRAALGASARIQIDGIEDVERLERLLMEDGRDEVLGVNLRVHPASGIKEDSPIIGGSEPSAFGVDEEDVPRFLAEAARFKRVRIAGLQVFASSNERNAANLLSNHKKALDIGRQLTEDSGIALEYIDLGGGLGIPYGETEAPLDIQNLSTGLARLLKENSWFCGQLILEPGRWLAGPCGVYLSKVLRTKRSRGSDFAILEGGINHLLRPLLTGQDFPCMALGQRGAQHDYILAGPLCTSLDRIGHARAAELEAGDAIMFGQVGAYGRTEAMGDFLSHPKPGEFWL
jgi:diaminopimelate decarboxylase